MPPGYRPRPLKARERPVTLKSTKAKTPRAELTAETRS